MASQIDIVNRAITKLGGARITSMNDNNKQARVMTALWDTVRQAELRKRFWSFALVRTTLPALATTPAWGFSFAYQLPPDFLRIVQVNDYFVDPNLLDYRNMDDSPYAIEGGNILTDFPAPLKIRYVADVTNPGDFDPLFVEAFASKLAYEGCEDLTQSNTKKDTAAKDYVAAVRDAAMTNAIEKPPQGFADDSWMLVRT